jgi:quercetin dioxygenase-like cupin family protein
MSGTNIEFANAYSVKDLVNYASGSTVSRILTRNKNGNITLFAFDKGQILSEHTAPFDATVMILEGSGKITIDKQDHILHQGEIIVMPGNIPHALEAIVSFKMMLIMIKS